MTDLEEAVVKFLKTTPRKRYSMLREIAQGMLGHYPSASEERMVKETLLELWEMHILDDKPQRQMGYRLRRQDRPYEFTNRIALKNQYKKDIVAILQTIGVWALQASVMDTVVGSKKQKRYDARLHIANRASAALVKRGIILKKKGMLKIAGDS